MSPNPHASQRYLQATVMTASPEQLQVMLLDGAIRFALRGREAIERKDIEAAFLSLERAQRIALALGDGLSREANPEVVDQMRSLYSFVFRRLVEANMKRDVQAVDEAVRVLRHQRETWMIIVDKVRGQAGPERGAAAPAAPAAPPAAPGRTATRFTPESSGPLNLEG